MTAVSKTKADDLRPREVPIIPVENITLNHSGMLWREFLVRLPKEFIADDLKEPSAWTRVQGGQYSLVKFDKLTMVSFDESWIAEAIVGDAGTNHVVISKPRITQMPDLFGSLLETEEYKVMWTGSGYRVVRKKDQKAVTRPVSSAMLAERDLAALYPAKQNSVVR